MPAGLLHNLHAKMVLEKINKKHEIDVDETAFLYGAQGPDIFFTHRILFWMKGESLSRIGTKFHETSTIELLQEMKDFVIEKRNFKTASYFLGFICHYILDSTTHPYINSISKELWQDDPKQSESALHSEIESELEYIVYKKKAFRSASDVDLSTLFYVDDSTKDEVADLYLYLVKKLFGEELSVQKLYEVMSDTYKVRSMMNDKSGFKKNLLSLLEFKQKKFSVHLIPTTPNETYDWANIDCLAWRDKKGKVRNESFFELFDLAVLKACDVIEGLYVKDIDELIDGESF